MDEAVFLSAKKDWERGLSVRTIAGKYMVPRSTVGRWVKKWAEESGTPSGTNRDAGRDARKAPERLREAAEAERDQVPPPGAEDYHALRQRGLRLLELCDVLMAGSKPLSARDLQAVSSTLLNARTLLGVQSPREAAESEVHLAILKRQAQEAASSQVTVRFVDTYGAEV